MRKPKERWPALRLLAPLSLWLWAAGCAGARPDCAPPVSAALSVEPFHWAVSGEFRKGLLRAGFEGDLLFVPPDTCRMIGRSAWGETLLDLKVFGDSAGIYIRGHGAAPRRFPLTGPARRGLFLLPYAAAGMAPPGPPGGFKRRCTKEGLWLAADDFSLLLDPEGKRLRRLSPGGFPLRLAVEAFEGKEGPPRRFGISYRDGIDVDFTVEKRFAAGSLTGQTILK